MGSQPMKTTVNFEIQLRLEAERVLEDVIFARAPIQSQLLRYLVDRTVRGGEPPSQYEIAVEGLGKDQDYDLDSDSYPRVQMSRLRRSLENYYARNLPGNGLQIAINPGSYELTLVRGKAAAPRESSASNEIRAKDNLFGRRRLSSRLAGMVVLAILTVSAAALILVDFSLDDAVRVPNKPAIALAVETGPALEGLDLPEGLAETARQVAEIQLSSSFVSKPLAPADDEGPGDYSLNVNFVPGERGTAAARIWLADQNGEVIFADTIPYDPSARAQFAIELEASLIYLTSPTGLIAQIQLQDISDAKASDYTCFLSIENQRSRGAETASLVNECIELFPESSYRAFWYARRAFTSYQSDILADRPIVKSGQGWNDLRSALQADRYNAFANFTAAKVEIALGHCEDATVYVERALERGGSYPALVAAVEAHSGSCADTTGNDARLSTRVQTIARHNPDPDPLLQLYLVTALLAVDDHETAALVAGKTAIESPQGPVEETSTLLRRSLDNPAFARANRAQINRAIYLFLWSKAASDRIVETLAAR